MTLFSGYTVLCTEADGSFDGGDHGLFHRDTRVLTRHRVTVGDESPGLVSATRPESDFWMAVLRLPRVGGSPEGPLLPQDALEILVERRVGPGLVEALYVTNHSAVPCQTLLRIAFETDFADVAELGKERQQEGTVTREVVDGEGVIVRYRVSNGDRSDERGLRMTATGTSRPRIDDDGLMFEMDLSPEGTFEAILRFAVLDGGRWREPSTDGSTGRDRQRAAWRRRRPAVDCTAVLRGPLERAADDLFDLRNDELEEQLLGTSDGSRWIVNAGVPMFTGLFGRDVLTAGWQAALMGPGAPMGARDAGGATPAPEDDAWRDAEPGKLIHELRSGPLAALGLVPRDAYYGTQTTPAMFVLTLSELWHWTGDDEVLRRHVDVARHALGWARRYGDLDGDGFLEYQQRSPKGLRNQGWKDSNEAIRHADGSIVEGPIATVEEQAFYVLALERMAEILVALGEDDEATDLLRRANDLRTRWHETFWQTDLGFYAMALDGEKRAVRSIGSNAGHALGAGIVPPAEAPAVADRLMAPDMFSGWGIRSLSERHPSYNPFAYHLGSVWPVEQATFALGFKRYGLDHHVDRLVDAAFQAAASSPDGRLPEALSGHARAAVPSPVPYPKANVPQAWSASALIQMLQITLGLYPFAPLKALAVVRPRLPVWVPELSVRQLRVGRAVVDLTFRRRPDGSASWRVTDQRGPLLVVPAGPPDDVGPGSWLERLEVAGLDRAPGRLARAARISLGRGLRAG